MDLSQDYICDATVDDRIITYTNNKVVLDYFNIQPSRDCVYDFRSKKMFEASACDNIVPTCGLLEYNPYICNKSDQKDKILNKQIKKAYLYSLTPGDCFSGTFTREQSNRFSFLHKITQACPYFDSDIYDYITQDDGLFEHFITNDFDTIQRICISVIHEEVGITVNELQYSDVNDLIKRVKEYWLNKLSEIREDHLTDINNSLQIYNRKKENTLEELFVINELQKERDFYNSIDLESNINAITLIYDVYRYFPFNGTKKNNYESYISQFKCLSKFSIKPINKWHHKQYLIVKDILPDHTLNYTDIEHNDRNLALAIKNVKKDIITSNKRELYTILTEEYEQFKDKKDEASITIANDIIAMRDKVEQVDPVCRGEAITDVINYWPPVLGKMPEIFTQS